MLLLRFSHRGQVLDLTLIFALQVLVGFVCFLIGLGLGSLIAAIWLRLAAFWLRLGKVNFLTAFNAAFTSNLIVLLFNFSIGFNTRLTMMSLQALEDNGPSRRSFHRLHSVPSISCMSRPLVC